MSAPSSVDPPEGAPGRNRGGPSKGASALERYTFGLLGGSDAAAPSLKRRLRRAERIKQLRAFALVGPLVAFVLIAFLAPIGDMLLRSVENHIVPETLPRTVVALESWNPELQEIPGEPVFEALATDLREAFAAKVHARLGARLNFEMPGLSSLFRKTPRRLAPRRASAREKIEAQIAAEGYRTTIIGVDKDWGDPAVWRLLKQFSGSYTAGYFLASVDRGVGPEGAVTLKPEGERIYLDLFGKTLWMSFVITLLTIALGYPVAYLLAALPAGRANLLMILVLLPFWTSLLARTSAWKVLLQGEGLVNDVLVGTGLNGVIFWLLSLVSTPVVASLCQNDLTQILAGGPDVLRQMADRVGVQQLSDCALQAIAVLKTDGPAAAMALVGEIDAAGRASGYGDERFAMVDNQTGVVIAMTHILLPFMILPLYAVMKTIPGDYVRAAKSLGATNWTAFWRVYFPNTLPGLGAGAVLVFILAIGYYITPEILGGTDGRFISNKIAHHISSSLNWGLAAALASLLLLAVGVLYGVYYRLLGGDNVQLR